MKRLYEFIIFDEKKWSKKIVQLENSLVAFSRITSIPVTFFSGAGKHQWTTMPGEKICNINREYGKENFACTGTLMASMNISLSLPEVYVFMCDAGLVNLCYALADKDRVYGFFLAGPVVMGTSSEKAIGSFFDKMPGEDVDYSRLLMKVNNMKLYTPKEIGYVSTLFLNAITAPLEMYNLRDVLNERHREQSEIKKKLANMRQEQLTVEYPYASESSLIEAVKEGNKEICRSRFSNYMEGIMVFEGGNLPIIKLRLIAVITQLLKNNEDWQKKYENLFLLEWINDAQTLKELVQAGEELVLALAESVTADAYSGSSLIVKRVIVYINAHYRESIHLKSVAKAVHVNDTYLSTLFKQEVGKTFVSYLNEVRLFHAKDLLINTAMSITEICFGTGFSSPSYFAKLFKEKNGVTPREFRMSLSG